MVGDGLSTAALSLAMSKADATALDQASKPSGTLELLLEDPNTSMVGREWRSDEAGLLAAAVAIYQQRRLVETSDS